MSSHSHHKRRRQGLCVGCGSQPEPGKTRCTSCLDKSRVASRKHRDTNVKHGRCARCSSPATNQKYCEPCREWQRQYRSRVANERIRLGVCRACGKCEAAHPNQRCRTCILKAIAHDVLCDRKQWQDLLTLYETQNGCCAYSNIRLTIGVNASIDHIIPKSKGGSSTLDNLQWVGLCVNKMKLDQTEDEFLQVVAAIAKMRC